MATHEKKRNPAETKHEMSKHEAGTPAQHEQRGSLSRAGRFDPWRQMRQEFDHMFDRFFRGFPSMWEGGGRSEFWGFDVEDKDDAVLVRAEAPGFEPGDFDLQVRGNQLVLSASHHEEGGEKEQSHWSQRELFRSVTLPAEVTAEKVDAKYQNGVLTIKLPKTTPSSSQRIEVKG